MWSPGKALVGFLSNITPELTTDVFITMIAGVLFAAFFQAQKGRHSRFLDQAPSIMTSLGILGTFVGIVIGLMDFKPSDIDGSINLLLGGLKTAFITSLVGMLSAIVFKFADIWWFAKKREVNGVKEEVTPADIHSAIQAQTQQLDRLRDALVGEEEGTLVGQMKLLRSDFSDFSKDNKTERDSFNERLWSELQIFAEMMSRSATEQVIEALKQVIVEFNENLTEQFGENFKALDESVKKLVVWQEQYKGQVEQMSDQYQQSVESLVETRTAVAGIWEECKEIPLAMAELRDVLMVNQHQIQELNRHLDAFVLMRDKAIEAVPQISQQLDHIGESLKGELDHIAVQLNDGAIQMKTVMLEGATQFKESVSGTNTAMTDMAHTISNKSEEMTETLSDTANQLNSTTRDMLTRLESSSQSLQSELERSVENVMSSLRNDVERTLSGVEDQIQKAVSRTGESVNTQVSVLDEALQKEMHRVMTEMGRALTTITGQFTQDYARLVTAMNTVVHEFQ
jgi:biopolymer transport protein ExbB/TolQ